MRSQRFRRLRLGIALLATALLDAACFGGQPAAQATTTAGLPTPTALASPRPLLSPLALASPAASPSPGLAPGEQSYTVEAGDTLATVDWDGQSRNVEVEAADAQPLIGMALMQGSELRVQVRPGGSVTIAGLP